jgi:apolipoprotein D and lipocalin family protein
MRRLFLATVSAASLGGCAGSNLPPVEPVEYVDLDRFMGDWYVIAAIPTSIEKESFNAIETYRREDERTIETTFTFRKGGFDGELKEYNPTGFVRDDPSNAIWGMQFIWPIKADYRIAYLDDDYSVTVIARNKRDYVWLMARSPEMPQSDYDALIGFIEGLGYDTDKIRKVPQRWEAGS